MSSGPATAVLLLTCPDRPGLVAAVAEFVVTHGGNILHADQHGDAESGVFVQRVEWALDGFGLDRDGIADAFRPVAERFDMRWSLQFSDAVPRIAILGSREPHCVQDLLGRHRLGELPCRIAWVGSNHATLGEIVDTFDVPFHHLPVGDSDRADQEAEIERLLAESGVELLVLARYMQILSADFVGRHPRRIINIHHSFLPAFAGASPYRQAHQRGVKIIGATAHYVTAELDAGPIIEQDVVRVSHRDSVPDLVAKGRDLEKIVLARATRLHLEHRVAVYGNKTVVFD